MTNIPGVDQLTEIGRGGFGTVYRGVQQGLGRVVAVKVLHAALSLATLQRFQRECRALGALSGERHVVTVHDAGVTHDGRAYLVMAHLPGGSLAERLRDGPLLLDAALRAARDTARGLAAAHAVGVLHRDVKPENVLVSGGGDAILVDFGIATTGGSESSSRTVTASLGHAAPEVIAGARADERADVYSTGSLLHQLLSGGPPFPARDGEPLVALIGRVATEPPPDLRARGVPDEVASVVERAMAKGPADRWDSAGALADAIDTAAHRLGLPLAPLAPLGTPPEPLATPPDPAAAEQRAAVAVTVPDGATDPSGVGRNDVDSTIAVHRRAARVVPDGGAAGADRATRRARRARLVAVSALLVTLALAGAVVGVVATRRTSSEVGLVADVAEAATTAGTTAGTATTSTAADVGRSDAPGSPQPTAASTSPEPGSTSSVPGGGGSSTGAGSASTGSPGGAASPPAGTGGGSVAGWGATGAGTAPAGNGQSAGGGGSVPSPGAFPAAEPAPSPGPAPTPASTAPSAPVSPAAPPAAPFGAVVGSPVVVSRRADGEPVQVQVHLSWTPPSGSATGYEIRRTVYVGAGAVQAPQLVARVPGGAVAAEATTDRLDAAGSYAVWEVAATNEAGRSAWAAAAVQVPWVVDLPSWDATQLLRVAGLPPAYKPLTVAGAAAAEDSVWAQSPRAGTGTPGGFVVIGVWSTTSCGANCRQAWPGDPARA